MLHKIYISIFFIFCSSTKILSSTIVFSIENIHYIRVISEGPCDTDPAKNSVLLSPAF